MVTATAREENGEFCVAVAPATRTADILSWLKALAVKLSRPSGRSGSYTGLIGFNHRRLKELKRGMSSHATDLSVYVKSSSFNTTKSHAVSVLPSHVLLVKLDRDVQRADSKTTAHTHSCCFNCRVRCTGPAKFH